MTAELDAKVTEFAPKVGVAKACAAFGVNQRSLHYRRQKAEGGWCCRRRRSPSRGRRTRRGTVRGSVEMPLASLVVGGEDSAFEDDGEGV